MKKIHLFPCAATALALCSPVRAAETTWNPSAPEVDADDISSLTGAEFDIDNVIHPTWPDGGITGGDDEGTFLTNNRPGQGQTFTTGGNAGGYTLSSITLQIVEYESYRSYDQGWTEFEGFEIKIGTIDGGGNLTTVASETSNTAVTDENSPGYEDGPGWTLATSAGPYVTFTLDTPVFLEADTEYAFSVYANFGGGFELNGTGTSAYAGGEAITEAGGATAPMIGDRVFHLGISVGADSDADNLPDEWELKWGAIDDLGQLDGSISMPIGSGDMSGDWDGDGLTDLEELDEGTNPTVADTDGDGLSDGEEVNGSANAAFGGAATNPLVADSDGDRISDGDEVSGVMNTFNGAPTNPAASDSDLDSFSDSEENYYTLFDPNSASSNPGDAPEISVLLYQEDFNGVEGTPIAEVTEIDFTGSTAAGLSGTYLDIYDNFGPIRLWYNVDGESVAPSDEGGSVFLVEIPLETGDPDTVIASATESALTGSYEGSKSLDGAVLTITDDEEGERTDANAGTSGLGVTVLVQGEPALPAINGEPPTVNNYGSANWMANSYLRTDGSVLFSGQGSALLPFDARPGFRYRASVDLLNSSSEWWGLGFSQNAVGQPGGSTFLDRLSDNPAGISWMLIRNDGTDNSIEAYGGPLIAQFYGAQGDEVTIDYEASNTLEVLINTVGDGSGFTTTFSVDGKELYGGPVANTLDVDDINYVGLTSNGAPDGDVAHDDFRLEWLFYDTDNDGLGDEWEFTSFGDLTTTDSPDADSDGDNLSNGDEFSVYFTNGMLADSDDDGLDDDVEVAAGTNPNDSDTDGDGLSDGEEVDTYSTDPLKPDSDEDGYSDYDELTLFGTDPRSAASFPQFEVLIDAANRNGGFELVEGEDSEEKVQEWDLAGLDIDNWTQLAGAVGDSGTEVSFGGRGTQGTRYAFLQPTNSVFNLTDAVAAEGDLFHLSFDQTADYAGYEYAAYLVYDSGTSGDAADIVKIDASEITGTTAGTGIAMTYTIPATSPAIGKRIGVAFESLGQYPFIDNVVLRKQITGPVSGVPTVVSAGFNGANFEVTVANLTPGTEYFLMRGADPADGFPLQADTLTAESATETFTDVAPPAGKAFYIISD